MLKLFQSTKKSSRFFHKAGKAENLVLGQFVSHFSINFLAIGFCVAEIDAVLRLPEKKNEWKYFV